MNVMVAGKQPAPQWLDMDAAVKHCTAGIGIWEWASSDRGGEPDVVMACAGDVPTLETLAAVDLLRRFFPDLKVRVVNVVDLMTLQPASEHPHGLPDRDFDVALHEGQAHRLRLPRLSVAHPPAHLPARATTPNLHVRGYKEEGTTTTPVRHGGAQRPRPLPPRERRDRPRARARRPRRLRQAGPPRTHASSRARTLRSGPGSGSSTLPWTPSTGARWQRSRWCTRPGGSTPPCSPTSWR